MRGARITGWGVALPEKIVTNVDLEATLDTTDEWIRERTGIAERRIGGTTAGLAVEASQSAMDRAGLEPADIDLLVLCTTTPDQTVPATSAQVQHELGLRCGAFDLNAACSGFAYGLVMTHGMIDAGMNRVLLVGSETLSRITDWDDRTTAVLFADGAGAAVVEACAGPGQLLGWDLGCDGAARPILYADVGGYIQMEGREVFRKAVLVMVDSARRTLERAGVDPSDVALVVPHQANIRIIQAAMQRLGIPMDRTAVVIDRIGNNSSASIPIALVDAVDAGRVAPGDLVLIVGFGAGMTWASALLRWMPNGAPTA
jgi:3-oxoacyl-[acyl-carrier-protein] synthase-3